MSTPRPAKSESSAPTRAVFCWTFPGAPIRINVPLHIIARLQRELGWQGSSGYRIPGAEVGGVLLGHRVTRSTLEIDDYVWVSQEQLGSQYSLDTSALERLRKEYPARDQNTRRSQVVGYFRTEAEDDLRLRDEEIALVRDHFREPTDVVLLIQTADVPHTSGFLFWMKEDDFAPFSLLDFPLDAGLLQAKAIAALAAEPAGEEAGEEETTRSLPAITDLSPPIADRDAALLGASPPAAGANPTSRLTEDVSFNLRLKPQPEWPQRRPSISGAGGPVRRPEPAETIPPVVMAPEMTDAMTPPPAVARRGPVRVSLRMVVAVAAVFAFLALAGLSAFLLRDRGLSAAKQKAPATAAAFPLQLDVEAQGEGLNVRWNPLSAPITRAREGRLTILEGDQVPPRVIPLDPQQLASGHIYYRSAAERVQFQMEIVDNSGTTSRESVLALSSTPAPAVTRGVPPQAATAQRPARIVESIPIPSANAEARPLAEITEALPQRQPPPRAFTAPPSSRDRTVQVPAITFDQAPAISANAAPPAAVVLPAPLSNLPAAIPPAPQAKEPPAPKQIRVASLQTGNLIKRVNPVYPAIAMSEHIQGMVRFTATIGKDGTVQNLRLMSGNSALVKAASDAVKQWLYRPTLLNGEPVEVVTQIEVNFALNQ